MKENKKIDNMMKAKKLAAYTLATCMTVTVAPIGAVTPIMAEEVSTEMYAAAEIALPTNVQVNVVSNIKPGMTIAEAQTAIELQDTATSDSIGTIVSKKVTVYNMDDAKIYDGSSYGTGLSAASKFEAGKKYKIYAEFDVSGFNGDSSTDSITDKSGKVTLDLTGSTGDSDLALEMNASTPFVVDLASSSIGAHLEDYPTTGDGSSTLDGKIRYIDGKGNVLYGVDTVAQNSSGWWHVQGGEISTNGGYPTMAKNAYGTWYIDNTGKVDFNFTGIADSTDKNGKHIFVYVNKGKLDTSKNGVVSDGSYEYNVVAGVVKEAEDIIQDKTTGKWMYFNEDGVSDSSVTKVAKNAYGTWFVDNGEVTFCDNGIVTDPTDNKQYFVVKSKVDTKKTGFVYDAGRLLYVKDGVVVDDAKLTKGTVVHEPTSGDWYAVTKTGAVDKTSLFVANENGTWAIDNNGKVNFKATGLIQDVNGNIGEKGTIYYVEKGKVRFDKSAVVAYDGSLNIKGDGTGLVATDAVFNIEKGVLKARDSKDNIAQAPNGNWYLFDNKGIADSADTVTPGLATNKYGVWYVQANRTVDFTAKKFATYISGSDTTTQYYVEKGKVQTGKTGWVLDSSSARNYVVNGRVITPANSIANPTIEQCAEDGKWYYVDNSKVGGVFSGSTGTDDFIASNKYGTWYVDGADGEVLFDKNGAIADPKDASKTYFFEKSKVVTNKSGFVLSGTTYTYFVDGKIAPQDVDGDCVIQNGADWLRVDANGQTDTAASGFDGIAKNKNGIWIIADGKVDFKAAPVLHPVTSGSEEKITGLAAGKNMYFKNGKFQNTTTGWVVAGGTPKYVKNGVETAVTTTDVIKADDGNWYAVKDGAVDRSGVHLAKNAYGTWYIDANGKVDFSKSGLMTVGTDKCLLEKGKLVETKTDVVTMGTSAYYLEKGKVKGAKATETMLVTASNGKIYNIDSNGEVLKAVSFAKDKNGIWVTDANGVVDKTAKAAVLKYKIATSPATTQVTISDLTDNTDYYVVGGKVQLDKSGLIDVSGTPKKVTKGVVTAYAAADVVQGLDGAWYAVKANGAYETTPGVYANDNGKWYVGSDSKVDFTKTGIVSSASDYYYVVKGKVQSDVTDVITVDGGMWNVKEGKVDKTVDFATAKNGNIYYVKKTGMVQTTFTGAVETATSSDKYYWVEAGKVDKNASGKKTYGGSTYEFVDGIGTR